MAERRRLGAVVGVLFGNARYKLLSIGLSVAAWWYVQGGQTSDVRLRAEVEWAFPKGLVPAEAPPTSVTVEVKGSRSATRRAQRAGIRMEADLSGAADGDHTVDFADLPVEGLPRGLAITRITPPIFRLELEPVTTRKVKVQLATIGEPAYGFTVVESSADPGTIAVQGPRSVVAGLREVATRPIVLGALRADASLPVDLELPWGVESLHTSPVYAKFDIESEIASRTFDDVPLVVRSPRWQAAATTIRVTLQGAAPTLDTIRPTDVAALLDVRGADGQQALSAALGGTGTARIHIVHPSMDKVRAIAIDPPTVEVSRP